MGFLDDVVLTPERGSGIISAQELMVREQVDLKKSMNVRPAPFLSVFLSLPREKGFTDEWDAKRKTYTYEGHDSTTVESGKSLDQLMMYESGKLTDNGKFFKAANAYSDGIQKEPMKIQVYEKLDVGVWYDKGIFDLVDAEYKSNGTRKVFKFFLIPADVDSPDPSWRERMIPASIKAEVWARDNGRCSMCGEQSGLKFVEGKDGITLCCATHSGGATGFL